MPHPRPGGWGEGKREHAGPSFNERLEDSGCAGGGTAFEEMSVPALSGLQAIRERPEMFFGAKIDDPGLPG